ncbi:hypothetical protein [Pseudozobellia thermophila]|uniref:Uncharacterized protein n=1 Tax=Pseudozobellia thermophila TaxID=192903 RepID=A0A1M6BGU0_9FLAO|nr:hypothetical protein [Pseudozobellia thermophila]SHI47929.1 hypothetical protein SAMN04488513_101417 [Pseudozobellia thermophila]
MRVLGTYTIKIKTYSAKDLGVEGEYDGITFNLYQKVFFLFLIPTWPIDSYWKIKKNNTSESFISDPELRTKLNLIELKRKPPFWAYIGTILLSTPILLLIGFLIMNLAGDFLNERQKKNKIKENTAIAISRINNPAVNDLYEIRKIRIEEKKNNLGKVVGHDQKWDGDHNYKLIRFSKDSLFLRKEKKIFGSELVNTISAPKSELVELAKNYIPFKLSKEDMDGDSKPKNLYRIRKVERNEE